MNSVFPLIINGDQHLDHFDDAFLPDSHIDRDRIGNEDLIAPSSLNEFWKKPVWPEVFRAEDYLLPASFLTQSTATSSSQSLDIQSSCDSTRAPSLEPFMSTATEELADILRLESNNSTTLLNTDLSTTTDRKSDGIEISFQTQKLSNSNAKQKDDLVAINCLLLPYNLQNADNTSLKSVDNQCHNTSFTPSSRKVSKVILSDQALSNTLPSTSTIASKEVFNNVSLSNCNQTKISPHGSCSDSPQRSHCSTFKKRIRNRRYTAAKPSRYCHICARHRRIATMNSCHNILKNTCQKSVCLKCISEHSLFEESGPWICPHCENRCPRRARCYTYNLQSQQRRQRTRTLVCERR